MKHVDEGRKETKINLGNMNLDQNFLENYNVTDNVLVGKTDSGFWLTEL